MRKILATLTVLCLLLNMVAVGSVAADDADSTVDTPEYTATFIVNERAKINIYYKQDYSTPDENAVSTAIARNSDTGEVDGSGNGQINFAIIPDDGYAVASVTVEGTYKNLKDISEDEGIENLYRITKIEGDLTVTVTTKQADTADDEDTIDDEGAVTLTFSDTGIAETASGSGYTIEGTTLTITSAGTFRVTGNCEEGSIVVNNKLSGVTLILDGLTLSSANTAPIVVKKNSAVILQLEGETTLTDNEDPAADGIDDNFEGAAIKFKSNSSITICGDGTLNIEGNAKNGIKGSSEASLIVNGGTLDVTAINNGIAADGSLVINDGAISVTAENDGIKSDPDEDDTSSAGTVEINGGNFTVNSKGDGIQAAASLTIRNGEFHIKTLDGYQSSSFDSDTMSCKGLKASGNDPDANTITITGGVFSLDTADDAVHSDGDIEITGGTFLIWTGDDGVHADTSLVLGTEEGLERDPEITIYASYEGLESGNIYAYSGKYYVTASDDGINAAGGSSNGTGFGPGNDNFRPGGWGGFRPGGSGSMSAGDYNMYIYGGDFYVNAINGDGLDSNGGLYLYGGTVTVFSQAAGRDNSPLDADGTILIDGATVFAAGSNMMNATPSNSSQNYYTSRTSRSAGKVVNVAYDGTVCYSDKLLRNVNYILYSSPDMTSNNCTISEGTSVEKCKSNAWEHNWDEGLVTKEEIAESAGIITYSCKDCGKTERKTISTLFADKAEEEGNGDETDDSNNDSNNDSNDGSNNDSNDDSKDDTSNDTSTPEPSGILGDVNEDGTVDAQDALAVLKHAARIEMLDEAHIVLADMNEDKHINAQDALIILKIAAKLL